MRSADGVVRSLPVEVLVQILTHLEAPERHASAAWVLPSWREACVVLALRDRAKFQPGAEGAALHPPLPLTAGVGERVREAMQRIEPGCTCSDWTDGHWNRWNLARPTACAPCRGESVATMEWAHLAPGELVTSADEPLLVTGVTRCKQWDAGTAWRLDSLYMSPEHAGAEFAVGKEERGPNAGSPVRLALKDYLQYMLAQEDSDPLYLFESDFVEQCPRMLHEYAVPTDNIDDDVLDLYDPCAPSRWLLIGPRGSGSDVHQDPAGSAAWNVCVNGTKRWVFVHPSVPTADVVGDSRHYEEHRPVLSYVSHTALSNV